MNATKTHIAVSVLIIAFGLGSLLTVQGVLPGVNWVWVLCLGVLGALIMAIGGIDKVTLVVGPFLIISTLFSLLRQTDRMHVDVEVPSLIMVFGVLLLCVQLLPVPSPEWILQPPDEEEH